MDFTPESTSSKAILQPLGPGDCTHDGSFSQVDGQTLCRSCGLEVPREYQSADSHMRDATFQPEWRNYDDVDSSRCYMRRHDNKKSVMAEVAHLIQDPTIIARANQLYFQVTQRDILRKSSRRGVIFACLFHAYKDHDKPRTPDELALLLSVTKKVVSKGLKYFYLQLSKSEALNQVYITPFHFFPTLWKQVGYAFSRPVASELVDLFNSVHSRCALLNRSNPQSVASAIMYYYICLKQVPMGCAEFASLVRLSVITISRLTTAIAELLNTTDLIKISP